MTVAIIVLAIVFGTPIALVIALELAISLRIHRHRRHGQSDREVAEALRPYGADITIAPASTHRNGAHREHVP
jgi:hypothetical protein